MTPGPYQFCNSCNTERAHGWIAPNIFKCIACNAETIVKDRPAIPREAIFPGIGKVLPMKEVKGKEHLLPEEQSALEVQLSSEPVAKAKEAKSEPIDAAIATAQVTELPLQGHEIKATPLEEKYKDLTEESLAKKIGDALFGEQVVNDYKDPTRNMGPGAAAEFDKAMKETAEHYQVHPEIEERPIPKGAGIMVQVPFEDRPKVSEPNDKPKPPTMNWADDL